MFAGTWKLAPEKNVLPARPDEGTRVTHIPPIKVVVAVVAAGSKVTCASGTATVKLVLLIVWLVNRNVTGAAPRPLGLSTLLNQIVESPWMPSETRCANAFGSIWCKLENFPDTVAVRRGRE